LSAVGRRLNFDSPLARALLRPLRPLRRLLLRTISVRDPWERLELESPLWAYGSGARLDFSEYLEGERTVTATSLDGVCSWLLGCAYESDQVLFHEPDFWQHPNTFERLRAGDCEDFAIWAWRKLVELEYDADLVLGYCLNDGALAGRHAWVLLRENEVASLLEPVARERDRMVRPLSEVRDRYLPEFGVDRHAKRFTFDGALLAQKMILAKQRLASKESATPI
jgi:hypothetical protein